ncbi:DUF5989 family protein [Nibricoccus sp. IMCC34717]|uniref:DUF5989 family protein n=1 Tax=Nibricoccus sp. IMCC34717 TaxID=3034021 RepID=UPI0038500BCE
MSEDRKMEFEAEATREDEGMIRSLLGMLRANKKWWLLPIFIVLLLLVFVVFLGSTGIAPFVYTLF